MRAKSVAALAEFLDISYERASDALNVTWAATMDIDKASGAWTQDPNVTSPGIQLAHRVQACLDREFSDEDLFAAVVLVRSPTGHIGLATTAISIEEVEQLLRLGIGAARRNSRQHGDSS
jgi:hypothetical protein